MPGGRGAGRRTPWRPLRRWPPGRIPAALRPWLADGASLSRRLGRRCPEGLRVRVLAQGWGRPDPQERQRLGLSPGRLAWVREVELGCRGEAWVRARTVVPLATWRAGRARLARLGERPLGSRLFPRGGARRVAVEAAPLPSATGSRWARRSLFELQGRPLLVTELFLALPLGREGPRGERGAPEEGSARG